MHLVMDSDHRCIPSILFIKNSQILEKYIENISLSQNDMQSLACFYKENKDLVNTLPIIHFGKWSNQFDLYKGIFDAAAIGQYLGGIDPRNTDKNDTSGFINETCDIKYNNFKFIWKRNINGLYYPYLVNENIIVPIYNLHIHSKNLHNFVSKKVKENKLISITT
jgi:hypothetical protein